MFNWLKELISGIHQHQWEQVGSYASLKDPFGHYSDERGFYDKSGEIYTWHKCKICGKERRHAKVYGKDGLVKRDYFC